MPASAFSVVMATGIVSIGARLEDIAVLDVALFAINGVAYLVLWVLTALRLAEDPADLLAELADHRRGSGFLAIVAATCVVGSEALLIGGSAVVATALLVLGAALWLVLFYALFAALTFTGEKPGATESVDGAWLLPVVATEAVAVLVAQLSPHWSPALRDEADFVAVALCLWGALLYAWIIGLILYRYVFARVSPADLTPTAWISMGAMAITALAGALLIEDAPEAPLLGSLRPFMEGFTILCWATATWWIPMLVILGVWRHGVHRVPLRYDVQYWGAVFPLGMYAVATLELERALSLGFLGVIPHVVFWIALAAWLVTFRGMLRRIRGAPPGRPPRGGAAGGRFHARSASGS